MSADWGTMLAGYLFMPTTMGAARVPAVVMMHGRAGAYSDLADGVYDTTMLSLRHKAWGREWAEAGHIAILSTASDRARLSEGLSAFQQ